MKDTVSHYVPPPSPLTSTELQAFSNNLTMPVGGSMLGVHHDYAIESVIFDRDNTLLQFSSPAVAELERRIAKIAPNLLPGVAAAHWVSWPGPWPRNAAEEPAFWQSFWTALATRHRLTPAAVSGLLEIGDFYHTCFTAFPDAAGTIQALLARRVRLGILTNFELPSISRTLQYCGLDPGWFHALISSSATGCPKPDKRAYEIAVHALNVPAQACLFVDDLLDNVQGARAAGMQAVLLDRKAVTTLPGCIRSLDELLDLI